MIKTKAVAIREPEPPPIVGVTLTLAARDASALLGLLGKIGGGYDGTCRESYDNVWNALRLAGVEATSPVFDPKRCSESSIYVK